MGVNYSGNYGIGYKVRYQEYDDKFDSDGDPIEDSFDLMYKIDEDQFFWFKVGNAYTEGIRNCFICVQNPFEDGVLGLTAKKHQLNEFCKRNEIPIEGEFGLHGGLEVS